MRVSAKQGLILTLVSVALGIVVLLTVQDSTSSSGSVCQDEEDELIVTHTCCNQFSAQKQPQTADDLLERLAIVSAISDNHVREFQRNLPSTHECLPNNTFIVYDLGLSKENRKKLLKQPYIKLRRFPFCKYKHLPYLRELGKCGWKPIMIDLVAKEYEVILYLDASQRLAQCEMRQVMKYLFVFPFVGIRISNPAIEFAMDEMIEYLQYPKQRKDIAHLKSYVGGALLLWANITLREKFLNPWVDCALHQECMSPAGSRRLWKYCNFTQNHDGHYVGCHRYDQSALNLILAREFGADFIDNNAEQSSPFFSRMYGTYRM